MTQLWTCCLGLITVLGCHSPSSPSGPPVEPVAPLALTCPGDVNLADVKTPTQIVQWTAPASTGGLAPVTSVCSPASGEAFPVGTTGVTCSAADSSTPARTAACNFKVTLVPFIAPIPVLSATRFMAFGDSITAGEINDDDTGARCVNQRPLRTPKDLMALLKPLDKFPEKAYPHLVEGLLNARYTNQSITVVNEGQSNNATSDTNRFDIAVQTDHPQSVLFLQGVIDLSDESAVPSIVRNIGHDILTARNSGAASFFLSTLTPVLNFSRGCLLDNSDIRAANTAIRNLAMQDNVVLVDSWAAFEGHESTYIGGDGLHPSVQGQQVLAQTFFDAIKSKLEVPAASAAPARKSTPSPLPGTQIQVRPPANRQPIGVRGR